MGHPVCTRVPVVAPWGRVRYTGLRRPFMVIRSPMTGMSRKYGAPELYEERWEWNEASGAGGGICDGSAGDDCGGTGAAGFGGGGSGDGGGGGEAGHR